MSVFIGLDSGGSIPKWKIFGENPNRYSYEAGVMIYLQIRKQLHSFHNGSHRVLYGRTST